MYRQGEAIPKELIDDDELSMYIRLEARCRWIRYRPGEPIPDVLKHRMSSKKNI